MRKYTLKIGKFKWSQVIVGVAVISVLIAVGAVAGVRHVYQDNLKPLDAKSQSVVSFTIPAGATLRETANNLKAKKIIKSNWAFERYVRNNEASDKIKAGTYELSSSYEVPEIVAIITEGKVATNLIHIIPGKRLDEVKKAFMNSGYSQAVVEDAFNPLNYKDHPALVDKPAGANLEGYLYPESFQRTADTQASTIVRAALDEMQKRLTPEIREAFTRQGLSVHQAVILGSMVEEEVSRPEDRPVVAQVFLKRLREGMVLGSDVTNVYGSELAGKGRVLNYDSPYNTHIHKGLPPGPISNVSESSLKAVAYPAASDWTYFVSGDDGATYFAHTLAEHQANIDKHCKKLCSL